jgi:hypothetical protein
MEPFNIRINYNTRDLTFTILPDDNMLFTIVYFGGVLCAIQKQEDDWVIIDQSATPTSGLPRYKSDHKNSRIEPTLTPDVLTQVGNKIDRLMIGLDDHKASSTAHLRRIKD